MQSWDTGKIDTHIYESRKEVEEKFPGCWAYPAGCLGECVEGLYIKTFYHDPINHTGFGIPPTWVLLRITSDTRFYMPGWIEWICQGSGIMSTPYWRIKEVRAKAC